MSPFVLIATFFVVAFACALGLCEWIVRRQRRSRDDDPSPSG